MVRLNNDVIDGFREDYVTSDQMGTAVLILLALYRNDYDFLDKLDDSNKDRKMILLYRDLVYKGYLLENEDAEDGSNVHFSLSDKSIKLIDSLNEQEVETPVIKLVEGGGAKQKEKEVIVDPSFQDVEDWIKDWITLFPIRAVGHSYPLRTGKGVCANKMRMFMKNNPLITKQQIFDATKLYLKDEDKRGWQYTQMAGNFISKSESGRGSIRNSTLETYCNMLSQEKDKPSKYSELEDNSPFL
jgi:hypothetical protein